MHVRMVRILLFCFFLFALFLGSPSLALMKLSKSTSSGGLAKQGEKKETPQERLKRIMSRQLNKQSIPYSMCTVVVKQLCNFNKWPGDNRA